MAPTKRVQYDAKTKRAIILYAEERGNREAERKFNVNEANIRRWRKDREVIFASRACSKAARRGPKTGRFPEIDEFVKRFVLEVRGKGLPVTREMLRLKALEKSSELGVTFSASMNWCTRFMSREGLSLRRRTSICQKRPVKFEEKLVQFQQYVIKLRTEKSYDFSHIGNADETPVYLDMPRNYSVEVKGAKEVKIKTTGYEKQRITVMLGVTADGKKLPPFLIFNRKTIPKEKFPNGIVVRAQVKGLMTNELMLDWINVVWNQRQGALRSPPSMLVLDAFKGHLTDDVKNLLSRSNCDLVVIPGGMTSQLQPLDVSINKPFKDKLRGEYEKWLLSGDLPLTTAGKIKKAPPGVVAQWVKTAWDQISEEIVITSFKKCCITNALDDCDFWSSGDDNSITSISSAESQLSFEADDPE